MLLDLAEDLLAQGIGDLGLGRGLLEDLLDASWRVSRVVCMVNQSALLVAGEPNDHALAHRGPLNAQGAPHLLGHDAAAQALAEALQRSAFFGTQGKPFGNRLLTVIENQ